MHDKEAIEMMQSCANEITGLKAEIARLAPKADAYDSVTAILRLLPQRSQGYGVDLVWQLNKKIAELKAGEPDQSA